jgi:F0F1-type ATP synthase assembly protein I
MMDESKGGNEPRTSASGAEYAGLGLQFAASILVFLYAGQWLDTRLGTAPWLMILGVFTGAGASFYSMYRKLMAIQEREDAARKAAKEEAARRGSPPGGPVR